MGASALGLKQWSYFELALWLCPWESEDPEELDAGAALGDAGEPDPESEEFEELELGGDELEESLGVDGVVELVVPRLSFL